MSVEFRVASPQPTTNNSRIPGWQSAFTLVFNSGEYDPESPEGQHLIAHEVVHTLQQPDAPISMMPKTEVEMEVDPDPAAEREADEIAGQVMRGWEAGLGRPRSGRRTRGRRDRRPGHARLGGRSRG
uniref:eCIS core domain-containing protein n=1 Tax=Natrialba magadii TaxID=13769 RepID=UPI0006778653